MRQEVRVNTPSRGERGRETGSERERERERELEREREREREPASARERDWKLRKSAGFGRWELLRIQDPFLEPSHIFGSRLRIQGLRSQDRSQNNHKEGPLPIRWVLEKKNDYLWLSVL